MKIPGLRPVRIAVAAVVLILAVFLVSEADELNAAPPSPSPVWKEPDVLPESVGLRIAVASDLHYDPDNTDKSKKTAVVYNEELLDALLWDVKQQKAEVLLLTGDLVNGGKVHRHTALVEKLLQAQQDGLSVYVLPGNHDLAPVTQQEFASLYAGLGYDEAYSRDRVSLSYCILREDVLILMMDTAGYNAASIDLPDASRPVSAAFLSEETLLWAESMLKEAKDRGIPVLCAGHYNLLPAASREPGGFYLENGTRFADLLRKWSVPLYLSGHMHIRAVYQENGLTELLTEYLLGYPSGYTVLDLSSSSVLAAHRRVDVDAWAKEIGSDDPLLLRFAAWQREELKEYCRSIVEYMAEHTGLLTDRESELATEFFCQALDAYWCGTLKQHRGDLEALPGCSLYFRCAEGYSYGWWLRDLFDSASPFTEGFQLDFSFGAEDSP